MGMNTAIKNGQILDNAYGVLGIEFMAAAQALDFREFTRGRGRSGARGHPQTCGAPACGPSAV
jgi:histidine ammonia-lyase